MRVNLLNGGGFDDGLELVTFPVEVEASDLLISENLVLVHESELKRIGGSMCMFGDDEDPNWPFVIGEEVELIKD